MVRKEKALADMTDEEYDALDERQTPSEIIASLLRKELTIE